MHATNHALCSYMQMPCDFWMLEERCPSGTPACSFFRIGGSRFEQGPGVGLHRCFCGRLCVVSQVFAESPRFRRLSMCQPDFANLLCGSTASGCALRTCIFASLFLCDGSIRAGTRFFTYSVFKCKMLNVKWHHDGIRSFCMGIYTCVT